MIHYVKGNLLESQAQALVNTVNNYRIYREACRQGKLSVGQMLVTVDEMNTFFLKKN